MKGEEIVAEYSASSPHLVRQWLYRFAFVNQRYELSPGVIIDFVRQTGDLNHSATMKVNDMTLTFKGGDIETTSSIREEGSITDD